MHRNAPPCQSRFGVSFAGAPSGSRFQLSLLIRLWRGNSARLIDARPCVAGRLARSSRRSRTEDKMASRPLSCNKRCPGTTWAVAPPAGSLAHQFPRLHEIVDLFWCRKLTVDANTQRRSALALHVRAPALIGSSSSQESPHGAVRQWMGTFSARRERTSSKACPGPVNV
jgi:hypothetical protein